MNQTQMFQALRALDDTINIKIRDRGDWYISSKIERKEGGCLSGGLTNGSTPEAAIQQFWKWATMPENPEFYLVLGAYTDKRRAVRWNGFMWEDVLESNGR